jgi:acetyltransferase-like isoleucine patch superfamily enzyme
MLKLLGRSIAFVRRIVCTAYARYRCGVHGEGLTVNYPSVFTRSTYIGKDCHFNGVQIVGSGRVTIGDHFHSGSGVLIITQNHNYYSPDALPYDDCDILGDVTIGNAVWIGSRVTILPKTVVGDGAVIQAGAVVSGAVPRCAVYGGNPARLIKYRDTGRFEELVSTGKYVNWSE